MDPEKPSSEASPDQMASTWSALALAAEMGYIIAIPAVVLAFCGAYVDKTYQSSPLFLIAGLLIAFLLSGISIMRRVRQITRK